MKSMCVCSRTQLSDDPTEECCPDAPNQPQAELCCFHYVVIFNHQQTSAACRSTVRSDMLVLTCRRSQLQWRVRCALLSIADCSSLHVSSCVQQKLEMQNIVRSQTSDPSFFTHGMHSWLTPPNGLLTHTRATSCGGVCEGDTNLHYRDVSMQHSEGERCPASTVGMHWGVFGGARRNLTAHMELMLPTLLRNTD